MALGKMSKLFIFIICVNSIVAFVASSGVYLGDADTKTMSDWTDKLHNQTTQTISESEGSSSGISILDYFNPLNYKIVADAIGIASGFFIDPIIMFGTLPNPLNVMLGTIFGVLELLAIVGLIRGVTV